MTDDPRNGLSPDVDKRLGEFLRVADQFNEVANQFKEVTQSDFARKEF